MPTSDPAIDAARRVRRQHLESIGITDVKPGYEGATPEEIAAAREALAPIRDLHKPVPCCPDNACDMLLCSTCHVPNARRLPEPWPCPTARLVYTTTELENP